MAAAIATPGPAAARIPTAGRRVELERRVEHLPAFVLVRRRHHRHVGKTAEVRKIERAHVRRAVRADDPRAVDREHDRRFCSATSWIS
jgi:hypothetical protein